MRFLDNTSIIKLFLLLALAVAAVSLIISHRITKQLQHEELLKMQLWATATEQLVADNSENDLSLTLQILQSNHTIPLILFDKQSRTYAHHNITLPARDTLSFLRHKQRQFEQQHPPIELPQVNQVLYYGDSSTLRQLKVYPFAQLVVLALFVALAFVALNRSLRAEQNKMFAGLAKETAHQLGTPISSLSGWTEYIKSTTTDPSISVEMDKDIQRLNTIATRFSKIGSKPHLDECDVLQHLRSSIAYLRNRLSDRVLFEIDAPSSPVMAHINPELFGWVIENVTKNAVDAMNGAGTIRFVLSQQTKYTIIDIKDEGKGIAKSNFKRIFSPGFTTKQRGWGMGLSLAKRIVEEYHLGRIYVLQSVIGKGTTFRIELRRA